MLAMEMAEKLAKNILFARANGLLAENHISVKTHYFTVKISFFTHVVWRVKDAIVHIGLLDA